MNLQDIPQDLIDTTTDILEARRNPELNPKIGPYSQLKKYADDPSIFISFTEVDKIGINPRSKYNTPLGIYTYPLKAAWKNYKVDRIFDEVIGSTEKTTVQTEVNIIFRAFPFASENPYIQVVRTKKPLTDLQDFTRGDLQNTVYQISKIIRESNTDSVVKTRAIETFRNDFVKKIREGKANPLVNTPGGLLWWLTMKCSESDVVGKLLGKKYRSKSAMRIWNYLLRDLGHDGFIDKGDSIIHTGEPTQAVFLHRKAFKKIDRIMNDPRILSKKKEKLYFWMNDNQISDDAQYIYKEKDDSYDWKSGTFIDGKWERGNWEDGLWLDGVWERGIWKDGIWKDGRFITGSFEGGTWKDGIFGIEDEKSRFLSISVFIKDAVWEDGTWLGGSFRAKEWQDGTWQNGTFENSKWKNGTWKDGNFTSSFWKNGTWEEGRFERSTWEDGKWLFGKFIDSEWLNGMWENGTFRGTWEDGIWKYGFFGVAPKNTQFALRNTIWNNGVWENGLFVKGEFNGGIWKDGFWFLGEWNGGQWQGGRIYSKRFGADFIKGNSTDALLDAIINISEFVAFSKKIEGLGKNRGFVESRFNPEEFYEIEEEVDTIEELEERVAP